LDWQCFNYKNITSFKNAVNAGELPYDHGFKLDSKEKALRSAAFELRYSGGVSSDLSREYLIKNTANELVRIGLGYWQSSDFRLNEFGKAFVDEIIDCFFQKYLTKISK
jgi:coproporphyrinogen III oxidase-like Fe-S oxidoreductase